MSYEKERSTIEDYVRTLRDEKSPQVLKDQAATALGHTAVILLRACDQLQNGSRWRKGSPLADKGAAAVAAEPGTDAVLDFNTLTHVWRKLDAMVDAAEPGYERSGIELARHAVSVMQVNTVTD